jgi:hypothetical protein
MSSAAAWLRRRQRDLGTRAVFANASASPATRGEAVRGVSRIFRSLKPVGGPSIASSTLTLGFKGERDKLSIFVALVVGDRMNDTWPLWNPISKAAAPAFDLAASLPPRQVQGGGGSRADPSLRASLGR